MFKLIALKKAFRLLGYVDASKFEEEKNMKFIFACICAISAPDRISIALGHASIQTIDAILGGLFGAAVYYSMKYFIRNGPNS